MKIRKYRKEVMFRQSTIAEREMVGNAKRLYSSGYSEDLLAIQKSEIALIPSVVQRATEAYLASR